MSNAFYGYNMNLLKPRQIIEDHVKGDEKLYMNN